MAINVYWSTIGSEWLRSTEPELIFPKIVAKFSKEKKQNEDLLKMFQCPAVTSSYKNLYGLKSIYDYDLTLDRETGIVSSSKYDQDFFDNHVIARSAHDGLISFMNEYIFFTDEKSLNVTACIAPIYEDNDIAHNTLSITGEYDIGKWFRPLDFPFFIDKNINKINIRNGDIFSYIKFDTKEKIKFHKFVMTPKLSHIALSCSATTRYRDVQKWKLQDFYNLFNKNAKKNILKEIKQNLV